MSSLSLRKVSPVLGLVDRLTQPDASAPALLVQAEEDWAAVALKPAGVLAVILEASTPELWGRVVARASAVAHSETPDVIDGLFPGVMCVLLVGSSFEQTELAEAPSHIAALDREVRWMALGPQGLVRDARDGSSPAAVASFKAIDSLVEAALVHAASAGSVPPDSMHRAQIERAGEATLAAEGRFRSAMGRKNPPVTTALLVACGLVFALQYAWDAQSARAGLLRMGALSGRLALHGRPELLLSYALLHGGIAHIAMNGLALRALGALLENVLGGSRMLMVFTVSALGGGLAAALFRPEQLVVGASGGIFGLMGALFALTLRRSGELPELARRRLRQGLTQALVLNVLISFLPGISLLGHAGGVGAGFALGITGLSSRGAEIPWIPAATPERARARKRLNLALGFLVASALLGSLFAAFAHGRPWRTSLGPAQPVALGDTGWAMGVPASVKVERQENPDGSLLVSAGDVLNDGFAVEAVIEPPLERLDAAADDAATVTAWVKARASSEGGDLGLPEAAPSPFHGVSGAVQRTTINGATVVRWTFTPQAGRVVEVTAVGASGTSKATIAAVESVEPHPSRRD